MVRLIADIHVESAILVETLEKRSDDKSREVYMGKVQQVCKREPRGLIVDATAGSHWAVREDLCQVTDAAIGRLCRESGQQDVIRQMDKGEILGEIKELANIA